MSGAVKQKLREPKIEIQELFDEIEIDSPIDTHQHWRGSNEIEIERIGREANVAEKRADMMMQTVLPITGNIYSAATGMPNLIPIHTTTSLQLTHYAQKTRGILKNAEIKNFTPLHKFSLTYDTTPEIIKALYNTGIPVSGKFYPGGATTNSEGAMTEFDVEKQTPNLQMMSDLGIPFGLHSQTSVTLNERGEYVTGFTNRAEREFVNDVIPKIAEKFPKLKIIIEHASTKEAIEVTKKYPNVYVGITPSHMFHTLHDLVGSGQMKPHNFITPIPNDDSDRKAIQDVVLSRHPRVMFGTDSAPHSEDKKECAVCASGVFSSPVALQKIVEFYFTHADLIQRKPGEENLSVKELVQKAMQEFTSDVAQEVYGKIPESSRKIVKLKRKKMIVPDRFYIAGDKIGNKDIGVVPMSAGEEISWSIDTINGQIVKILETGVHLERAN